MNYVTPAYVVYVVLVVALLLTVVGRRWQSTVSAKDAYTMKWLSLIGNLAPFVLAAIPGVPPVLIPAIVHGIQTAEQIPGASGAQKKAAVLDLVATGLTTTNSIAGSQKIDASATLAAVSSGIDATVNAVNAVHSVTNPPASAGYTPAV